MPPKRARGREDVVVEDVEDVPTRDDDGDGDDDDSGDSDSESESSDSDSDLEIALPSESTMDKIMRLERVLTDTPTKYNGHVHLIRELRTAKLKERLREARQAFSDRFALNPIQWREWISDEIANTKGRKQKRAEIVGPLFEKAVTENPNATELWLGYFEYTMDQDWDSDTRRGLYERALECAGADFEHGHKLFAARRAFETARTAVDGDSEKVVQQRISNLWKRQLRIPHHGIKNTERLSFQWISGIHVELSENILISNVQVSAAHALAVAQSDRRANLWSTIEAVDSLPVYDDVTDTEDEKQRKKRKLARDRKNNAFAVAWRAWLNAEEIDFESSDVTINNEIKLQSFICAYERAIAATPTDVLLWRRYTSRLERSATVRQATRAHERAVRHCPTSGETWVCLFRWRRLHGDTDTGEIDTDALAMVKQLTETLPPRSPFTGYPREYLTALEETTRGALSVDDAERALAAFAGPHWTDPALTLQRKRVACYQKVIKPNTVVNRFRTGNTLWAGYIDGQFANVAEVHVAGALYARDDPDETKTHECFKQAYGKCDTLMSAVSLTAKGCKEKVNKTAEPGWVVLCRAWMDFERIRYALPEHFYEADAKAGVRLREFEAAKADRALSALDPEQAKALRRANDPTYVEKDKGKKRIRASEPINENANAKRRRGDDAAETDTHTGAMNTEDNDTEKAPKLPSDPVARAEKYKELFPDRDSKTAFVKNLPFKCSEQELELHFEEERKKFDKEDGVDGKVTARIVMDKQTGKPRGFAYVDFSHEKTLRAAVMRDGQVFQGRPLGIAVSLPPGGKKNFNKMDHKKIPQPASNPNVPSRRPSRGLGFGGGMTPRAARVATGGATALAPTVAGKEKEPSGEAPKSNADFRAQLLSGFKKSEDL
ncbi:hypothetical protein OAD67_02560 [bacterium]|nr:hypothetical protein [bacterium]